MFDIQLEHITHRYKDQSEDAVSDLSLLIEKSKINGLLGPNGAGKTTLIHIICGLIDPLKGKVIAQVENRFIADLKKRIGFVPQQDGLFADLTLAENLNYFGGLYSLSKKTIRENSSFFTEYLHLTDHLNKQIKHFSGGMNRRANIIAGLLHDPDMIIFDEPTAGVDIQSRALIHEVIKDLRQKNKTILYTSHLLSEAQELCDVLSIMDHGHLLLSGTPDQLLKDHNASDLEHLFLSLTGHKVRD